jgi:hypothetical protein
VLQRPPAQRPPEQRVTRKRGIHLEHVLHEVEVRAVVQTQRLRSPSDFRALCMASQSYLIQRQSQRRFTESAALTQSGS